MKHLSHLFVGGERNRRSRRRRSGRRRLLRTRGLYLRREGYSFVSVDLSASWTTRKVVLRIFMLMTFLGWWDVCLTGTTNLSILVLTRIQEFLAEFCHRGIGAIVRVMWDQLPGGGLRSPSTSSMYYIAAGAGHRTKCPPRKQKESKTKDSVVKQHRELPRVDEVRYFGIFIKVRSAKCKCSVDHAKRLLYHAANGIFTEVGRLTSQEVLLNLLLSRSTVWTRTFASDEQTCDLLIFNQ